MAAGGKQGTVHLAFLLAHRESDMQLEHEHTSKAIRERLQERHRPNYLGDWIYGGIDGVVTTLL